MQKCFGISYKLLLMGTLSIPISIKDSRKKSWKALEIFTPADLQKPEEALLLKFIVSNQKL